MIETGTQRNAQEHAVGHHTEQAEVVKEMDTVDSPEGGEIATRDIETWAELTHMDMET